MSLGKTSGKKGGGSGLLLEGRLGGGQESNFEVIGLKGGDDRKWESG